jgi:hypothetical protein
VSFGGGEAARLGGAGGLGEVLAAPGMEKGVGGCGEGREEDWVGFGVWKQDDVCLESMGCVFLYRWDAMTGFLLNELLQGKCGIGRIDGCRRRLQAVFSHGACDCV